MVESMTNVTVRNTLNGERVEIPVVPGRTVRDAVAESGFVAGDDFSVRDKLGGVVDHEDISGYAGKVVNVGLPGNVEGG